MKRTYKKYLICLSMLLILGTGIVVSIGQLRSFKIKQPQGIYMQAEEAGKLFQYLSEYIQEPNQANLTKTDEGTTLLTYEVWTVYLKQLAEANFLTNEQLQSLERKYENNYLLEHFVLEADFLETFCQLAEWVCPEEQICLGTLELLEGGRYVSFLDSGENFSDQEILTLEGAVYQISFLQEEKQSVLQQPLFQKVNCLYTNQEIIYLPQAEYESLKESETVDDEMELTRCFLADARQNPVISEESLEGNYIKVYWGTYCLWILNETQYNRREDVTDLFFAGGKLQNVEIYQDKVNGKILSLTQEQVELEMEGLGSVQYPLSEDIKAYKLYGDTPNHDLQCFLGDLAIGYDFTDFVLDQEGKVVAALVSREEKMDNIRVLLKNSDFSSLYHEKIVLCCDAKCTVVSGTEEKNVAAGTEIEITKDSNWFTGDRILIKPGAKTAKTAISSIRRNQGVPVYRGNLEIVRTKEGLLVVNELLLEEYLYSVVPSEMPSSYPIEAQKAQAISARTYAYQRMEKSGLQQFGAHVDDSTSYQVYNNIEESSAAMEAVRATSGIIAKVNGKTAGTYFYSTSCGVGTTPEVWHGNSTEETSHLQAKEIASQEDVSPQQLREEEDFAAYIQNIHPSDFEKEEGWYRWSYKTELDTARLLANLENRYEAYPAQILTREENGNYSPQPISQLGNITDIYVEKRLAGGVIDELVIVGEKNTIKVISERNVRFVLANTSQQVNRQSGDTAAVSSMIPSAFAILRLQKQEDVITGYEVIGGGYGHGIGMSQNGAKNMAEQGYNCQQILEFFYEGIQLE